MNPNDRPPGMDDLLAFPLLQALIGRRSRRFALGATIPDGPLAFTSRHAALPLTDLEQLLVLIATAGNTGWHYLIPYSAHAGGKLPSYAAAAGGRTFPSAAGWHTSEVFFTNDGGVYAFATRDAPALAEHTGERLPDLDTFLEVHRTRIRKLADGRLHLPPNDAFISPHNAWSVNCPGSMLLIPVADVAQQLIALLCVLVQRGLCIYDDVSQAPIDGLEMFRDMLDLQHPLPLSLVEQEALTGCAVELGSACYAGMLLLQAMGLGGWMFDGINWLAVLGASGDPAVPGLGFRYDHDPRWLIPNPTGLPGVFEGFCPPHYPHMEAAVEAFVERKYGEGGPYNATTSGPWKDSARVRGNAVGHDAAFRACVAAMAQAIYDRFGKFPGTVPSLFIRMCLQAHHLDLEFYDHYFQAGAYLPTHAHHLARWHGM